MQFASRNSFGFTFQDVAREFPEKNPVHLSRILTDMVILFFLMQNKVYYIGYASAMQISGSELDSVLCSMASI